MQHIERGGLREAPSSSTVSVPGRCKTQMWSCRSTAKPPTCPIIQLLGSSRGHSGSTWYLGASWAQVAIGKALRRIANAMLKLTDVSANLFLEGRVCMERSAQKVFRSLEAEGV